jgi:hypothetical protein
VRIAWYLSRTAATALGGDKWARLMVEMPSAIVSASAAVSCVGSGVVARRWWKARRASETRHLRPCRPDP